MMRKRERGRQKDRKRKGNEKDEEREREREEGGKRVNTFLTDRFGVCLGFFSVQCS